MALDSGAAVRIAGLPDVAAETPPAVVPRGRDEVFGDFFRAQFTPLARYCYRLTRDEQASADIAQEALVRLYSRWIGVREPRAYVYLIATNLVRDRWKSEARERSRFADFARTDTCPAEDNWLRDLVERLPERLRVPVLLHYYADLAVEEVARLVNRPVGTVKQRLHEARARLADAIGASDA